MSVRTHVLLFVWQAERPRLSHGVCLNNTQLRSTLESGLIPGVLTVSLQALDPDVWDTEELLYSLQEPSSLLGIESTSGQVYVLDLTGMGGETVTTRVKATDIHGLSATAEIQASLREYLFSL